MATGITCLLCRSQDWAYCPLTEVGGHVGLQCSIENMSLLIAFISSLPDAFTQMIHEKRTSCREERGGKDGILACEQ